MTSNHEMSQVQPSNLPLSVTAASRNVPSTTSASRTTTISITTPSGQEISAPFQRQAGVPASSNSRPPSTANEQTSYAAAAARSAATATDGKDSSGVSKLAKKGNSSGAPKRQESNGSTTARAGAGESQELEKGSNSFKEEFDDCDAPIIDVPSPPSIENHRQSRRGEEDPHHGADEEQDRSGGSGVISVLSNIFGGFKSPADLARERHEQEVFEYQQAQRKRARGLLDKFGIDKIVSEMDSRGREIEGLKKHIDKLMRILKETEGREAMLSTDLGKMEKVVSELQKEISTSRAFVETDDKGDAGDVKESLSRISQKVDDLSVQVIEEVTSTHDFDQPLSSQVVAMIMAKTDHQGLQRLADELSKANRTVSDYLFYGAASVVASTIQTHVFGRFKPGLKDGEEQFLKIAYESVKSSETQDRAARWRSITYERIYPANPEILANIARSVSHEIVTALYQFLSPFVAPESLTERWENEFVDLAQKCLAWHEMTKTKFLSWDYSAVIQSPNNPTSSKDRLLAIQGFGLVQRRMVAVNENQGKGRGAVAEEVVELSLVPGIRLRDLRESDR